MLPEAARYQPEPLRQEKNKPTEFDPKTLAYVRAFIMRTLLRNRTGNAETLADDFLQQTCEQALKSMENPSTTFRGTANYKSWLCGIAKNMIRQYRRKPEFRKEDLIAATSLPTVSELADRLNPGDILLQKKLVKALELLRKKSEHRYQIFALHYQDYDGKEIGEMMHLNPKTVRSNLHYAKKTLQEYLNKSAAADEINEIKEG